MSAEKILVWIVIGGKVVGILGAIIGGWLFGVLGLDTGAEILGKIIKAIIGAAVLLLNLRGTRRLSLVSESPMTGVIGLLI
jgi:hypothetical protein